MSEQRTQTLLPLHGPLASLENQVYGELFIVCELNENIPVVDASLFVLLFHILNIVLKI